MERFCIIANQSKEAAYQIGEQIATYLHEQGKQAIFAPWKTGKEGYYTDVSALPQNIEAAVVLGGDGTILQAANDAFRPNFKRKRRNIFKSVLCTE